jgi:hypothetical protein
MSNLWKAEPTMILAVVQAGLALGMGFGLHISAQQMALILTFTGTVLALVNRSQVTSPQTLQDMSPKTLAAAQDASQPVKDTVRKLPAVLLALTLAGSITACGPKQYHALTVGTLSVSQALFDVQDAENAAFAGHLITPENHAKHKAQILTLLMAGDDLTMALRAWEPSQPIPANIGAAIASLQLLLSDLNLESPTLTKVIFAVQTALSVLRGIGVTMPRQELSYGY